MFHDWDSFYLLIGSAAGALIGLLFVVVTLTTGMERSDAERGQTFYLTPVVFHFAMVVVASAVALTPRLSASATATVLAACVLVALAYSLGITLGLRRRKTVEPPHWSDFWCYGVAPTVVYAVLATMAVLSGRAPTAAPYGIAAGLLALLLISIRNAWDLVTWLAPRAKT